MMVINRGAEGEFGLWARTLISIAQKGNEEGVKNKDAKFKRELARH